MVGIAPHLPVLVLLIDVCAGIAHCHSVDATITGQYLCFGQVIAADIIVPPCYVLKDIVVVVGHMNLQVGIGGIDYQTVGEVQEAVAVVIRAVIGLHIEDDVGIELTTDIEGRGIVLQIPVNVCHLTASEIVTHLLEVSQTLLRLIGNPWREHDEHLETGVGCEQVIDALILPHRDVQDHKDDLDDITLLKLLDEAALTARHQPVAIMVEPVFMDSLA
jgi:hypothetical protein